MTEKKTMDSLTVVVTGASSGIGKGLVRYFAARGANVVAAARRTKLLEELAEECSPNTVAVTADVGSEADNRKLFDAAMEAYGRIDVWINNASVGAIGPYEKVPVEDVQRLVRTNVYGVVYGSHLALRQFKQQGTGTLINISSVGGRVAIPFYTAYSASKFAVTGFTAALAQELELEEYDNIHVCAVHPWATDTPWFEHSANYSGHEARMKGMDDPQPVIEAIADLVANPKPSIDIGLKTKGASLSSRIAPEMTEAKNAGQIYAAIQDAPHAPPTSGALHEPMESGTEVDGGMRKRMKKDD